MICFEVSLNGEVLCTTGTSQGVLNLDLMRVCLHNHDRTEIRLQETIYRAPSTGDDLAPKLRAALQQHERPASTQTVHWIDRKSLRPGDKITVRLVDVPVNTADVLPPPPPSSN
jgi:hypothetical protein